MSKQAKKKSEAEADTASSKRVKPQPLIVRPSAATSASKALHIYAALDTLRKSGISAGQFVALPKGVRAIATPADIEPDIVLLGWSLRRIAGLRLGSRLTLAPAPRPPAATQVVIAGENSAVRDWELAHEGFKFGNSRIVSVEVDSMASLSLDEATGAALITPKTTIVTTAEPPPVLEAFDAIGGLSREVHALKSKIELPLRRPDLFERFNTSPERGFLLHGPPGTGKTMLLNAVAESNEEDVHILRIDGPQLFSKYLGETESALRAVFAEAERFAPALIFIDEIDALAPRRDSDEAGETESRVVATLLTTMDGMDSQRRVVVLGATNRPNRLDPALRRPGRFGVELEVAVPDSRGRNHILNLLLKDVPRKLDACDINDVAAKTHGYVGADLQALVREAVMHAIENGLEMKLPIDEMFVRKSDLEYALIGVRPSAMREISLEMPNVRWSDIGGQASTIQRLRETVEWPLQKADAFKKLGISPPRGVLLYGPPGCSKTLLAKALATESGLNFLAVKGPELFNKYVGESERALREVFRKARQAAPSIIFFDEIDALSLTRGDGEAGGDRVLTTLLNEMDGVEALRDVVVLGATNRPSVIDPALMRPGRLDRLIYVAPPDLEARRQILLIQCARMATADDVNLDSLAEATNGFSGAEITAVCQEAGLLALNDEYDEISQTQFEAAIRGIRRQITPEMILYFEQFTGIHSS